MKNNKAAVNIALLSLSHMAIDFLCAFSLYRIFADDYQTFLLYNFCAFAVQMPLGIIIDTYCIKSFKSLLPGRVFTIIGILLTIIGSYLSCIVLGIGNAFFHVGGGVLTIKQDNENGYNGKGLGIFVAPGAIGLFLGTVFHSSIYYNLIHIIVDIVLVVLGILIISDNIEIQCNYKNELILNNKTIKIICACFIVVVLRSLTGMAISFPWKNTTLISFISVIFLALGKSAGGLLSSSIGMKKTTIITLLISAIAYGLSSNMYFGLLALFFFNMTMPLTLYLLSQSMKNMPGFAFGILTFALFIGYLPVLYGYVNNVSPTIFGSISSIASLIILYYAIITKEGKDNG